MEDRVHGETLRIYLNDHLALARGAEELAERCREENHGTDLGRFLSAIAGGFRDDQEAIREMLKAGRWRENAVKEAMAWLLEKAGRLKPNDRLIGYSDLSRVEELQALVLALQSMESFWDVLEVEEVATPAGLPVPSLVERREWAAQKRRETAALCRAAAVKAFLRADPLP